MEYPSVAIGSAGLAIGRAIRTSGGNQTGASAGVLECTGLHMVCGLGKSEVRHGERPEEFKGVQENHLPHHQE
jgi:hypothetical protein